MPYSVRDITAGRAQLLGKVLGLRTDLEYFLDRLAEAGHIDPDVEAARVWATREIVHQKAPRPLPNPGRSSRQVLDEMMTRIEELNYGPSVLLELAQELEHALRLEQGIPPKK